MAQKANHALRVERRAKYLATLTSKERRIRDDYLAWIRWWKREYTKLSLQIHKNKVFVRTQGHNNIETLKVMMRALEKQRLRARTMLLARPSALVEYQTKMGDKV